MSRKEEKCPIPAWMRIDKRPMDKGEWQQWGYGYSRKVNKRELWRPAKRYFVRKRGAFNGFEEVQLLPDAYFVSDHGRIFSTIKQRIITKRRRHLRRETQLFNAAGEQIKIRPYKLALDNWIEPNETINSVVRRLLDTVNHKDGRPWNDYLSNLQYSPMSANLEHQHKELHKGGRKKKDTTIKKRSKSNEKRLSQRGCY